MLTVGSSGGTLTIDTARRLPIKTIVSGPAGGVSQAVFVGAAASACPNLITYDIGGTSTDVCLISGPARPIGDHGDHAGRLSRSRRRRSTCKSVGAGGG